MNVSQLAQQIARANPKLLPLIDRIASFFSRRVLDQNNAVQFDADDLPTSLGNLLASSGAAAAISTLTSGTDLTTSGVLTTLGTNVGAHTTQGGTLRAALDALAAARTITPATTFTGAVVFNSKISQKVIATAVAAAGSAYTDAAALGSANIVRISSDSAAKGVKLLTGVPGDKIDILNTSSTAAVLYPATGGTINGLAANAGVVVPASKGIFAVCTAADTWTAFDRTTTSTAA